MRASSPDLRRSRLSTLSKDMLEELVHTVSEEYEGKLKKQKKELEDCAASAMTIIREEYDLFVWKCQEGTCKRVFDGGGVDGAVGCDGCQEVVYCRDHNDPSAWNYVTKLCDILYPQMWATMGSEPDRNKSYRMCPKCYSSWIRGHKKGCSCVVTRRK